MKSSLLKIMHKQSNKKSITRFQKPESGILNKQYETNLIRILEMPSNFTNSQSVHNLVLFIHNQKVVGSLLIFLNCTDHMPTHFDIMQNIII